jgi:hypothetical protein|tara:strand:- start:6514 stop:7269 length:756 start_codon:yes stop_codon:yes gene_type:complete
MAICKTLPKFPIKNGGRGKIKKGAGAALSRIQFTNETKAGKWSLTVAANAEDAYNKGVRAGEAWQLGIDIGLICEGLEDQYCTLQPIPGNVHIMSNIENDIYAGKAAVSILKDKLDALTEQIMLLEKQIVECEKAGCPEEEIKALMIQQKDAEQEKAMLEEQLTSNKEAGEVLEECWNLALALFAAESENPFPGEPKKAGAVKTFVPAEEADARASEANSIYEKNLKRREMEAIGGKGEELPDDFKKEKAS